ncbi:TPA: hypothetical protein ACJ5AY_001236 [Pseudomonas aeruginosa]|uniref:hypothetical protein n=1 Tax=Pseudomonas aeruginosa TaxID=287 RepID=UPI00053CF1B5|nr:hypothetical protein [Pseudomonas aeruginosa]
MSERYRVEQTGKGFWPYCVRAGNGTRDLYVGHKKTCDRVAAELTTAFRDGEFVGKGLYDALAAEAQALREERDRIERNRDMWKGQCERQAEKLEALRARFVVPDGYALVPVEPTREMFIAVNKEDDKAYAGGCDHGAQFDWLWDAALEAAPRLNGKTVSEGLLRRLLDSDGIDGIFDAQQNYAAHQELRALLSEQE